MTDGNQRAFQVVQQATGGDHEHKIVNRDPLGQITGRSHYLIRCKCGEFIEGEGADLAGSQIAAERTWHAHADGPMPNERDRFQTRPIPSPPAREGLLHPLACIAQTSMRPFLS